MLISGAAGIYDSYPVTEADPLLLKRIMSVIIYSSLLYNSQWFSLSPQSPGKIRDLDHLAFVPY